jgi:trk system potassium uptake protein TrkH
MAEMRKHVETLTLGEIMALTSFAWLLIPTIATIPYLYYGVEPVDAFFESISSWTSAGLTALESVEVLPKSIILFRSVTQWIGGLGIVVLMLTLIKGKEALSFLKAEGLSPSEVGIGKTVGMILKIYITLSILGIAALYLLDISLFDAVNLSLSGVSNGGSFPFDHYEFTNIQKIALAMLMFAGATSFLFYRNISKGKFRKAFFDEEYLLYVSIIIVAIALIYFVGGEEFFNTVLNTISSIACGGYAIGDLSVLHAFPIYILILLMLSGGMLGSTTGGIKLWRILVIIKAVLKHVKAAFLPTGTVQVVKINGKAVREHAVAECTIFVFAYLMIFLFGAGVFIAASYSLQNSLFMVASALGSVGLSTISVAQMPIFEKLFLSLLMYLGRIEIFPSLALISFIVRR